MKRFLKRLYQRLPIVRELRSLQRELTSVSELMRHSVKSDMIRLTDFDLSEHPRYSDSKRLLKYEFQVSSQAGEDGSIHEIFHRIGLTNRTFVEVGIGDGTENNTAFLLSQGWSGFWIDGNDQFLETLSRRSDLPDDCLKHRVAFVTKENISPLFDELGVPKEPDLLSLDIDQNTLFVWEGMREYRPRVVAVEYNAAIPPDLDWSVEYDPNRTWDGTQNFGASLKAFEKLGADLGYSLVGCSFLGLNAFFVRNDLIGDQFLEPYTSENHYEPPRYSLCHLRHHGRTILDRKRAD